MTSCLPEAKPVPCPPRRPRPTASVRGRCEAASTEATDLQAVPKGAIHNAPLKTERSLITLTRPAVVQPGYQGLASHVQWRRNRNGRFTHCRPLTNDLGHGHGVGGSADGYLGTNATPHTVILDKASSATAPPRNGTRASRLDSATSSALYEPTRLALSGTTMAQTNHWKIPGSDHPYPFHTDHCPCGSPHPAVSVLRHRGTSSQDTQVRDLYCPPNNTAISRRPRPDGPQRWQRIVKPSK